MNRYIVLFIMFSMNIFSMAHQDLRQLEEGTLQKKKEYFSCWRQMRADMRFNRKAIAQVAIGTNASAFALTGIIYMLLKFQDEKLNLQFIPYVMNTLCMWNGLLGLLSLSTYCFNLPTTNFPKIA